MKKHMYIAWKLILVLIIAFALIVAGFLYSKRDKLITSNVTMDYFEKMVNTYDTKAIEEFVADSNNNVLYNNFVSMINNNYFYEGVSDFNFEVVDKELFGDGKYQCYFANAFENYTPKCDLENKGRYINYLVDVDVKYKLNDEVVTHKEKGLVVFVKDMAEGNYFTWKLVRFDRYKIA